MKINQFNIEVITKKPEKIDDPLSYWGRITIGSFSERFVMPIDSWTLEQYKQQWKEGLDRVNLSGLKAAASMKYNCEYFH